MKVFLLSFPNKEAALSLSRKGVEIIYWTGSKDNFIEAAADKTNFAETIFHDSFDALAGRPAPAIDFDKLPLPPAEIYSQLASIEPQVLTMISRADYDGLPLSKKINLSLSSLLKTFL